MPLNFVSIDFETANGSRASVIQVGVARVIDGVIGKTSTQFINPPAGHERFAPANTQVHGLHPSDIVGAPEWPSILNRLQAFTYDGELPLVAHNAVFERSCIDAASEAYGLGRPTFQYFCTLRQAKKAYPDLGKHRLDTLTAHLGLPAFGHHDAGEDAVAGAKLAVAIADGHGRTSLDQMKSGWLPLRK